MPGPGNAASTTLNLGTAAPANLVASPTSSPNPQIQPGQFVQPALDTKAKVELLTVKRIKEPETGNRDVVNVQMHVRRATSGYFTISIASLCVSRCLCLALHS
ncbi:hypothetical protein [Trichocoleus sp. FACHB-262]|uniref:hypothetical protein n=1 Tax=Trichocoleus sp. FACHB-262 TaxID=2692869 RepID=UPI0016874C73|nr:hypothetical protein [Trichocoleus sp. FACHB-262]MBD2121911.1 hypothetical protein [Trichocoleus sp. FACHB-262]